MRPEQRKLERRKIGGREGEIKKGSG